MSVTVRTCSSVDEKRRSLEIYNEAWPRRAVTPEDVEAWERMAVATVELLGSLDGVDVGSAAASVHPSRQHVATVLVTVLPHARCRGVGGALLDAAAAWVAAQGVGELETPVEAGDEASLRFAAHRGFREYSREIGLELLLDGVVAPAVEASDGVEIALLADRPELARGAYDVGLEALPDVPGSDGWTPPPYEKFVASHLRGLAVHLALADGEVIGYAKLHAGADGKSAEHGMTAVKRAWRGRGVATSLKRAQIAWAKESGLERLTTETDERNAPMRSVNEALGYRPTTGWIDLRARIAGHSLP